MLSILPHLFLEYGHTVNVHVCVSVCASVPAYECERESKGERGRGRCEKQPELHCAPVNAKAPCDHNRSGILTAAAPLRDVG